jgi:signal transduction histidine kinase
MFIMKIVESMKFQPWRRRLSIRQRFSVLLCFSLVCFSACGAIGFYTMSEIKVNGPIYQRIASNQNLIADVMPPPGYIIESYLVTLQLQSSPDAEAQSMLLHRLQKLEAEYYTSYARWRTGKLEKSVRDKFIVESHGFAQTFFDTAFNVLMPALANQDQAARAAAQRTLRLAYESQRAVIEQVVILARESSRLEEVASNHIIDTMIVRFKVGCVVILLLFLYIFHLVRHSISNPISKALDIAKRVAGGDWHQRTDESDGDDEMGQLMSTIKEIVMSTQKELLQSEKLAALGAMVAGVSHELNTPVGNGLLAVSTLSRDLTTFRAASLAVFKRSVLEEFLRSVDDAVAISMRNLERAALLVSSFKQIAVDRASAQRRQFSLIEVVMATLHLLDPTLRRCQCAVELDVPASIELDSFPGPLGQVISNLVENAVNHAFGDGGGTISIAVRPAPNPAAVVISVTDHGKGIPVELHGHVFEPFFTTRLGQGGSGLGLSIVYNIVTDLLGGQICLTSEEGAGARFDVTIPLRAPRV